MTANVIELEIPDVEPGACRTCRAPLIHGFESHMLDCPVLRDEDAEVVPLFPADADQDTELDSAYEAVFDQKLDKMQQLTREFVDALRAAARHPNPGALVFAARSTLRAGFNCGFLFAKARYGGGG